MAEVITRFKAETTQYDSALRDTAKRLSDLSKTAELAGNDYAKFTQKSVEAARALGQTAGGATNAKDKVKELVGAYNQMASAYNALTETQRKSDFAKAMAESLTTLQDRIKDAKQELYNAGDGVNSFGGIMEQLSSKLTINVDAMKLFQVGMQGIQTALNVAKDAFFASEQNIDDWGRTVYSAQSVYDGFLTALNTGDLSGFLNNINTIVRAAGEAYNALDRLGTMQTIQSPELTRKQSEIQRMQTMLRTGRNVAPVDGRTAASGVKDGQVLTKQQLTNVAANLKSALTEVGGIYKQQVRASTNAIDALYQEQAKQLGMSNEQFRKGTASMAAFGDALDKARKYQEFERQHTQSVTTTGSGGMSVTTKVRDNEVNPYKAYKGWSVFKDDGNLYKRIVQEIQNRAGIENQYYGIVGQSYRGINRAEGVSPYGGSTTSRVTTRNEVDIPEIKPQTLSITVDDAEALKAIQEIQGVTIDPKTLDLTADDNATPTIAKVAGETIDAKNVEVTADDNASPTIDKVEAVKFKPKTIEVRVDSVAAMKALNQIQGVSLTLPVDFSMETTESMKQLTEQLRYYNDLRQNATNTEDYLTATQGIERTKQQMGVQGDALSMGVSTDMMTTMQDMFKQSMIDTFGAAFEGFQINEKDVEGMKEGNPMEDMKKGMEKLSSVMSGLSSITSGLSAVGIKLDGEFGQFIKGAQGLISVVQGVMAIITASSLPSEAANTISTNANTIALGVLTDTVAANSIIHAIPGLANGGVIGKAALGTTIPGNSMSGDNLRLPVVGGGMIAVNSGETILNRAETGNLVAQMEDADRNQGGSAQPYLDGELIYLGLNNYLRRSGMGEIVTSN